MKMTVVTLSLCALALISVGVQAEEQAATKREWLVEVRYFTDPESKMEQVILSIPLKGFATTAPEINQEGFEHLDGFEFRSDEAGIHLATARSARETQLPVTVELLSDDQAFLLVKQFQSDAGSNIVFAPKVILPEGEIAHISDVTKRPFVTGLDPQELNTDQPELRPVIQTLDEGAQIHVRVRSLDGGARRCDVRLVQSAVMDLSTMSTGMGTSTVQIPEVQKNTVEFAAKIQQDQHLLIWWPNAPFPEAKPDSAIARAEAFVNRSNPGKQNTLKERNRLGMLIRVSDAQQE